jgi:hypothetical protein
MNAPNAYSPFVSCLIVTAIWWFVYYLTVLVRPVCIPRRRWEGICLLVVYIIPLALIGAYALLNGLR